MTQNPRNPNNKNTSHGANNKTDKPAPKRRTTRPYTPPKPKKEPLRSKVKNSAQSTAAKVNRTSIHDKITGFFDSNTPTPPATPQTRRRATAIAGTTLIAIGGLATMGAVVTLPNFSPFGTQRTCATELARWDELATHIKTTADEAEEKLESVREKDRDSADPLYGFFGDESHQETAEDLEQAITEARDLDIEKLKPSCPNSQGTIRLAMRPLVDEAQPLDNLYDNLKNNTKHYAHVFYCRAGEAEHETINEAVTTQLRRLDDLEATITGAKNNLKAARDLDTTRVDEIEDTFELDKDKVSEIEDTISHTTQLIHDHRDKLEAVTTDTEMRCDTYEEAQETYDINHKGTTVTADAAKIIDELTPKADDAATQAQNFKNDAQRDLDTRKANLAEKKERERIEKQRQEEEKQRNKELIASLGLEDLEILYDDSSLIPTGVTRADVKDLITERKKAQEELEAENTTTTNPPEEVIVPENDEPGLSYEERKKQALQKRLNKRPTPNRIAPEEDTEPDDSGLSVTRISPES